MKRSHLTIVAATFLLSAATGAASPGPVLWKGGQIQCRLVLPDADARAASLAKATLGRYLQDSYGVALPEGRGKSDAGIDIVAGTPANNLALQDLVSRGLKLTPRDIGDEGFQIVTFEEGARKSVVLYGRTPRAIKHACQELMYFRIAADAAGATLDWPLDAVMVPEVAYRGIYMLPCWSQHDSIASWKRVLQFTSELTLNRAWFWLDGFPVAGHKATSHDPRKPSDYASTPLARNDNVQGLIDLVNAEDMKLYIGGGWMSWHQGEAVGKDREKARQYYLDYLRTFKGVGGFYFEPTGEGSEVKDWRPECESLREFIRDLVKQNPEFEIAVAIGRFNNAEYLKLMSELDPKRVWWWWCWGDPHADKATSLYSSVLAWHTVVRMSDIHGTIAPPSSSEKKLAGIATSYDPGMGFGNPWNGGSTLGGAAGPRDFHPYTMPYFSHEYKFRERCWNTQITDDDFAKRLANRLFDADMPAESISVYLRLADFCFAPAQADDGSLARIEAFVREHAGRGTARNRDTLSRMREALEGLKSTKPARQR